MTTNDSWKVSDIVAKFLSEKGIDKVFAISGGASLHLIHSLAEAENTDFVCTLHEQAAAYAADGYARVKNAIGCAIATSGPGATNLITGIASAYFDSLPMLVITGQVASFRSSENTGVRQIGFQETDIVKMCKPITKYSVKLDSPYNILFELHKAYQIAMNGRPGPVLVDIPDDFQRMNVHIDQLTAPNYSHPPPANFMKIELESIVDMINRAERPVFIAGWGVCLSKAEKQFLSLIEKLRVPYVTTWAAKHIAPTSNELNMGGFGTHGNRCGNFIVQNSDLVIALGARLDTKATGSPPSSFARGAKIIMVDIDPHEIRKFEKLGRKIDLGVEANVLNVIENLVVQNYKISDRTIWLEYCKKNRTLYHDEPMYYKKNTPYDFVIKLSGVLNENDIIFSDTGCVLAWFMQAFQFRGCQKFYHAYNNTPMGYALPASFGASLAVNQRVVCLCGDGSIMMSINELCTIAKHRSPILILVFNNKGHGMVRQTQDMWLNGNHFATSINGGLPNPKIAAIAIASGIKSIETSDYDIAIDAISNWAGKEPFLVELHIDEKSIVEPQVKFGKPNEDSEPYLDRKEFFENMLVTPLD